MTAILAIVEKTPPERVDFDVDLGRWLPSGDTVDTATVTFDDTLTVTEDDVDITADRVKVWLTGGEAEEVGVMRVLVTTTAGRIEEFAYRVRVKES